jgi:hypothetical protein
MTYCQENFKNKKNKMLRTDHKPLVSIFGEKKGISLMSAHRLLRYAIFLSSYKYKIEFIKGVDNSNADALSRLPLSVGFSRGWCVGTR